MKKKLLGIFVCMLLIAFTISPVANIVNDNENAEDKISSIESRKSLELTPSVDQWPMFRHDLQNIGYSTSPSPISNDLLWAFGTRYVYSTPAIVDGRVYFGSDDEDFFCLDANTGSEIWQYPIPRGVSIASPVVYEGKVYQGTVSYNIFCWNAENGSLIWNTSKPYGGTSSAAVAEGKVYIGMSYWFYCLDAETGEELWSYAIGSEAKSCPVVYEGKVYFGTGGGVPTFGTVNCLDADTGDEIWIYNTTRVVASPAIFNDKVYIGSWYNYSYGIFYCLDADTGEVLWNFTAGPICSSAAVAYGNVYYVCGSGKVYCLDADTGDVQWDYTVSSSYEHCYSSPAVADGRVYVGIWSSGDLLCLDAYTGELIWDYPAGTPVWLFQSPAIAYGRVYFGGDDKNKLYCFGPEYYPPENLSIDGPDNGRAEIDYNYTFVATDPNGFNVSYMANWGDGIVSDWIGPYPSGVNITLGHNWSISGYYSITVKAMNMYYVQSDWSDPFDVIIIPSGPPPMPGDPYPFDGATDVDVNDDLGWVCGELGAYPITYDVYYGDSSPPPKVVSNQSETIYDLGTMNHSTQYYWKIVAWDSLGLSTSGPVWDFTTEGPNNPPNEPSDPDPENGGIDVEIESDLSWTGGDPDPGDTVSYDIYFGTSSPPPKVISNQSITTYDPGDMNFDTTYYWKIVSWDNHGVSSGGSQWSFTTRDNNPPNTPSDPDPSDDSTDVDINADLSWKCSDPDGDDLTYDVYFEANDPTPDELVSNNQSEDWYDPGTMEYDTHYYWQIVAWDAYGESTSGPVWDFTTGIEPNDPPYVPSDPDPVNNSNNIDIDADLSWTGGDPDPGDTVVYDVYLEANDPTPDNQVADNIIETTFDPGTLEYETIYYWRVIAKDNHGASTSGPVWQFTTELSLSNLECNGILEWTDVKPGETVTNSFTVENIGDSGSLLDWEIIDWPNDWGIWTFTPLNGDNLTPEDGELTVNVSVVAPDEKNEEFSGEVKIVNKENSSDLCIVDVSLATPKNKAFNFNFPLLSWLLERFPILQKLLEFIWN